MKIKRNNLGRFVKGTRSVNWKGGRSSDGQGYIRIWKPDHPSSNHGYILEQRLVVERQLGRYLKKNEVVHHINGVRNDNRIENLVVMTRHEHPANHQIGRPIKEETKEKIRKSLMGHSVTEKTRKAVSKKTRERYASGEVFGFQKGNRHGETVI